MQKKILLLALLFVFYSYAQEKAYKINIRSEIGPCTLTINDSASYSIPATLRLHKGNYKFHFFSDSVDIEVEYNIVQDMNINVNANRQSYFVLYQGESDFEFDEAIFEYVLSYSGKRDTIKIKDINRFVIKRVNAGDTVFVVSKKGYKDQTIRLKLQPFLYYQIIPSFRITNNHRDARVIEIQNHRKKIKNYVIVGLAATNAFFVYKYFDTRSTANTYYNEYLNETTPDLITKKYDTYKAEFSKQKTYLIASVVNGLVLAYTIWFEPFTDLSEHLSENRVRVSVIRDNRGNNRLNLSVRF